MSSMKKAARLGATDLQASLTAASTGARARIAKLDAEALDTVAGGIDIVSLVKGDPTGGDGTTWGMFPEPTPTTFDF
ncbi:hypothetical protein [Alteriqipengyuania lutimaris]|uniref:Uncharacterized protein n=1 Tax=Alteriqipengyuania lutimaris TaxID=1538146 RepID=A0A395LJ67_9SPHN|nr:hypothetical protein [Alteriqipengyuania lutimaris]MBB3034104.1 hypothetical protein [Alteriqipengyuania lutimaris]RDS76962.1 hypothetical protein DL238_04625 [Alteriqipengyuania lutimaris]